MAFERFMGNGRGYRPKISIWDRGQIMFNKGAIHRFEIDKYKYAVIYYDKDSNRIGFSFTNDQYEDGALKITNRNSAISISVRAFLQYYNINHDKTKRYDINFDEKSKLYTIKL